jgi:hypothetical protein
MQRGAGWSRVVVAAVAVALAALLATTTCPSRAPEPSSPVETKPLEPATHAAARGAKTTRSTEASATPPRDETTPTTPAPAADATPTDTKVRIVVTAADGGGPIAGAAVAARIESNAKDVPIRFADAVSGADGVALIDLLGCQADISVRKSGFITARVYVPTAAANFGVQLARGTAIRGRVVYADTRGPAVDVAVRAWGNVGDKLSELDVEQRTGADGRFELAGVPVGDLMIYAVQRGYRTADWVGKSEVGLDVELVLGDGGVLEGVVTDADGRAMPGVDVFLLQPERPIPRPADDPHTTSRGYGDLLVFVFPPTVTDAAGRYRFVGARLSTDEKPQPRCAVARTADGREVRSAPVVFLHAGERQTRDLQFAGPGTLRVVVKGPSQLAAATLVVVTRGKVNATSQVDDSQTAVFERLAAGTYSVHLQRADEHRPRWDLTKEGVEVKGGETTVAEFDLGAATSLAGRVVDDAGTPLRGISVRFMSDAPDVSQSAGTGTDEFGQFQFDALLPTMGHLVVEKHFALAGDARLAGASWIDATPGGPPVTIVMRRVTTIKGRVSPVPRDQRISFDVRADDSTTGITKPVADDGSFEYAIQLSGERVFVSIRTDEFAPVVVVDGTAPPGETIDLGVVKLDAGVTLDLVLHDADGKPLAGATVDCLDFFLHGRTATADAAGRVRFEKVPRHALRLLVHETATTPMARPVIADPAAPPAVLTIAAGALVTGRVVDGAGGPLKEHVLISFRPKAAEADPDGKTTWVWTENDGAYRARLEPGLYRVLVRDKNQGPALTDSVDLAVADGETRTLDLRLR